METISLSDLHFGHDRKDSLNSRATDRDAEIGALAANIHERGLIYPLLVTKIGGKRFVAAGNRRLAALKLMESQGLIPADWPVPCIMIDAADAKELSLAENVHRQQLHPIDEYEAFAGLGQDAETIARRFGLSVKHVRQRLALGSMAPEIRKAWRAGEIQRDVAQAFTATADQKKQAEVYKELKKAKRLYGYEIKRALVGGQRQSVKCADMALVGLDAYLAAGGTIAEDLFSDEAEVESPEILNELVAKRRAEIISIIAEAGAARTLCFWEAEDFYEARLTLGISIDASKGLTTPADYDERARAWRDALSTLGETLKERVVLVKVPSWNGVEIVGYCAQAYAKLEAEAAQEHAEETGTLDPTSDEPEAGAEAPQALPAPANEDEPDPWKPLAGPVREAMSQALTVAVARVVADNPVLALRLLLAGLHTTSPTPVRARITGFSGIDVADKPSTNSQRFGAWLEEFRALDEGELIREMAIATAASLDLTESTGASVAYMPKSFAEDARCILDALPFEPLAEQLRQLYPVGVWLEGATKAHILAAIREALPHYPRDGVIGWNGPSGDVEALMRNSAIASKKKPDLMSFAEPILTATGWLPPEFRTAGYSGPGADAPTAAPEAAE